MTGPGIAIVLGARGGIGAALRDALAARLGGDAVVALGRPELDLADEASIARAASALPLDQVRLVLVATGLLHGPGVQPEKSLRALDPAALARSFLVNAIGPALVMKHLLPRMPRQGRAVFACLSARVGSIGDNRLGGWYGYRASKAALNQMVRTAAVEWARTHPEGICVALHPGTVATGLSAPFTRPGQAPQTPDQAAARLLAVLDGLVPTDTGGFFDWRGQPVPW